MGRYAFFTTGLEYKFRFGVQPSEDMRFFGGVASYENHSSGDSHHHWEPRDCEGILEDLKALAEGLNLSLPSFETYENSLQGTHTLHSDLYRFYQTDLHEEVVARFILGSLIYHQLQYEKTLSVTYEA